jgi:RNA polymerase sigma-70 factor (ECF subfamily)
MEGKDPDRPLVAEAQAGSERAMELLFRRHVQVVYTYALRATSDGAAAEEIAQETFIRAFRAIRRFDGRSSFRTWLFAIAINRMRTHAKKRSQDPSVALTEDAALIEPEEPSLWTRKRLVTALGALPDGYRDAVIMHDVLEMEHDEIARARGCTVGTSKSQLHKARAKLRQILGPREGAGDA